MPSLNIVATTIAKQSTAQAASLPPAFKTFLGAGTYSILRVEFVGQKHYKVTFPKPIPSQDGSKSFQTWCVFAGDINAAEVEPLCAANSGEVKLGMKYRSQRNNRLNPRGACNVTSFAMCLDHLGAKRRSQTGQFEDELYEYCLAYGLSRHTPQGLKALAEAYGVVDQFDAAATVEQIKGHLRNGKPVVLQGYFTDFGHIIALNGCNDDGFWALDPNGEWNPWGYTLNNDWDEAGPGENVFYSNRLIQTTCDREGIWAHFLSK